MVRVRFIQLDGTEHEVVAQAGESAMEAARNAMVPGVIGECSGSCICATCQVYVDEAWMNKLPESSSEERAMLEHALHTEARSRLSCQITLDESLDGLCLYVAPAQY